MSILNTLNIMLESKLVRYFLFLTLLSFVFISPFVSATAVAFLSIAAFDLIYVPVIMAHIKKTGKFYLVFDALNKVMTLVAISFVMLKFYSIITSDFTHQIAFSIAFLYIINYNFDINDTFFSEFTIFGKVKNHTEEGYSKEATELIKQIENDEIENNKRNVFQKGAEMLQKYIFNAHFQFGTLRALILGDEEYLQVTESISLEWGMKEVAAKMTAKEIIKNNLKRFIADAIVFSAVVWTLL